MHAPRRFASLLLLVLLAAPALADDVWLLAPVYAHDVSGAFGSLWDTELRVFNDGDTTILLTPPCNVPQPPCVTFLVPPRAESQPLPHDFYLYGGPRAFALVSTARETLPHLTFQLRVFDKSRSELNWGTDVPVVEWDNVKASAFWFVSVPATTVFRHSLRVYAVGATQDSAVRVRYFDADSQSADPVAERTITFTTPTGYEQIDSLTVPELLGIQRVRIEVRVVAGDVPVWPMVSVTNWITQAVLILPGRHW